MEEENERERKWCGKLKKGREVELWSMFHKTLIHPSCEKCYTCFYLKSMSLTKWYSLYFMWIKEEFPRICQRYLSIFPLDATRMEGVTRAHGKGICHKNILRICQRHLSIFLEKLGGNYTHPSNSYQHPSLSYKVDLVVKREGVEGEDVGSNPSTNKLTINIGLSKKKKKPTKPASICLTSISS